MWPAPSKASAASVTPLSVLTKSAARASRSAHSLAPGENLVGERAEALLAGPRGERLLLGPEGQVQIFEPLHAVGVFDFAAERVGEFVLRFDRTEDRLLAFVELAEAGDAVADEGDLLLVEAAGLVAAIARNEGNGVALVQERDRPRDGVGIQF